MRHCIYTNVLLQFNFRYKNFNCSSRWVTNVRFEQCAVANDLRIWQCSSGNKAAPLRQVAALFKNYTSFLSECGLLNSNNIWGEAIQSDRKPTLYTAPSGTDFQVIKKKLRYHFYKLGTSATKFWFIFATSFIWTSFKWLIFDKTVLDVTKSWKTEGEKLPKSRSLRALTFIKIILKVTIKI